MEIPLIPEVILHVLLFCILCLHSNYASWPGISIFFCGSNKKMSNNPEVMLVSLWYGVFLMIFPYYQLIELWIACGANMCNHVTAAATMEENYKIASTKRVSQPAR